MQIYCSQLQQIFTLTRISGYFPKCTSGRNGRKFGIGVERENGERGGSVGGGESESDPAYEF